MSLNSIFKRTNLIYIPLSITIAHISNFIINSPLSTWQEFPPKLPGSVYFTVFFTPLLLFISLSFEPIQTRKRFYTLLLLTLIYISIPISFRERYPPEFQNYIVAYGFMCGTKMFMFLKSNRAYLNKEKSDQKKEFRSYFWSLFNWRPDHYIIPPKSKDSNEKEIKTSSPSTSQINQKLFKLFGIFFIKWLIFELSYFILTRNTLKVPEKAFQIRLFEFIMKGIPVLTKFIMLQYLNYLVAIYLYMSLFYDFHTIFIALFFRFFIHSTSEKDKNKSILIRSGLFTLSEFDSLNQWLVEFIFNTKGYFKEPWMATSPRDFWSVRWQTILNEAFRELGYLPVRNFFTSFTSRKFANAMGVLGAFGVSGLLHEYMIIGDFDIWTGEQFIFFMINGVILILWEAVFGREDKNDKFSIKKRILIWMISLIILPFFLEPFIRKAKYSNFLSLSFKYYPN